MNTLNRLGPENRRCVCNGKPGLSAGWKIQCKCAGMVCPKCCRHYVNHCTEAAGKESGPCNLKLIRPVARHGPSIQVQSETREPEARVFQLEAENMRLKHKLPHPNGDKDHGTIHAGEKEKDILRERNISAGNIEVSL